MVRYNNINFSSLKLVGIHLGPDHVQVFWKHKCFGNTYASKILAHDPALILVMQINRAIFITRHLGAADQHIKLQQI